VGDVLIVKLEGNPTTGYNWEPENKELTTLEMDGLPDFNPDKNMPGSPGMVTLRFNAVATGQETLKLVYHRSWEADEEPLDTFTIIVEVK